MRRNAVLVSALFAGLLCHGNFRGPHAGAAEAAAPASEAPALALRAQGAAKLDGLGDYGRKITTHSPEAQAYFDQGLRLIYAFNHDEAIRSFAKAVAFDPACAMCYWGAGEALGPNYNMPMLADRWQAAWEAIQLAQKHAAKGTPEEQALIAALAKRYKGPEPVDPAAMQPLQAAYTDAMRAVASQFPKDDDVQVFFAEALMTSNPWKLWTIEDQPAPGTEEIVATLETVLARSPSHPGANHYYIHAVEASPRPELAVAAAERLGPMMPSAGHLVHMPAHIFQRVGRYEEASAANRNGAAADRAYVEKVQPPRDGYYGMYYAHNFQFLAYSAAMEGRADEAIDAARRTRAAISEEMMRAMPGFDYYVSSHYPVMVRFGRWDQILAEPQPAAEFPVLTGQHHFARAVAFATKGRIEDAVSEQRKLDALAAKLPPEAVAGMNPARDVFALGSLVAGGRIALARGDAEGAVAQFQQAVAREDRLAYDEPRDWFVPTRHLLGAALLAAKRPKEAEATYREDLKQNPENGWALFGLASSLRAQGKADEATEAEQRFQRAWRRADVTLTASAF